MFSLYDGLHLYYYLILFSSFFPSIFIRAYYYYHYYYYYYYYHYCYFLSMELRVVTLSLAAFGVTELLSWYSASLKIQWIT